MSEYDVCEAYRELIVAALDADPEAEEVHRSYAGVGEIAWEDCCGQLVVVPERTYRYEVFPVESVNEERCVDEVGISLLAILVRCVPTLTDSGGMPSVDEQAAAARRVMADKATIWNLITSTFPDGGEWWERAAVSQTVNGPNGGCVAIETRWTVGVPALGWVI